MKFIDLTNQKFGKLTARSINKRLNGKIYWNCDCDCGNKVIVEALIITMTHMGRIIFLTE